MSDLLYTVFTTIDADYEEEFQKWQNEIHCSLLMSLPGYHSVIRYRSLDRPFVYSNFWHIRSKADFDNPERTFLAADPMGKRLSPYRHRHIDFYIQEGGLCQDPPRAEEEEDFGYLLICRYSNLDDAAQGISPYFRSRLDLFKAWENVLDAKIYHAWEDMGQDENYLFLYMNRQGGEEEARKTTDKLMEEVSAFTGIHMELYEFGGRWFPAPVSKEKIHAIFHDSLQ